MSTQPYAIADNGDPIARHYRDALPMADASRLSLGVCPKRCSCLKNRKPLAFGWRGTARASTKSCPMCGDDLRRMTRYRWTGCVQLLGEHAIVDDEPMRQAS